VKAARLASLAQLHLVRPAVRAAATPAMMNATATGIASKLAGANLANIGKLGVRTPILKHKFLPAGLHLPTTLTAYGTLFTTTTTPASTSSSTSTSGTTTSTPSTPPPVSCSTCGAGVSVSQFESITAILDTTTSADGTSTPQPCVNAQSNSGNCNALHVGDVLTISGSGFSNLAQQVQLFFLGTWTGYQANVITWSDTLVTAQIPSNLHGLGNQTGILSLGGANCACDSTLWTFNWVPVITTQYLPFDLTQYPPNSYLRSGTYTVLALDSSTQGAFPGSPDVWQASYSGTGDGESDFLFPAFASTNPPMNPITLKNGWTATGVTPFTSSGSSFPGSGPCSVTQAPTPGSTSVQTNVNWNYSGGGYIGYQLSVQVQGEAGTSPTCDSPVDPSTGAVIGTCQN